MPRLLPLLLFFSIVFRFFFWYSPLQRVRADPFARTFVVPLGSAFFGSAFFGYIREWRPSLHSLLERDPLGDVLRDTVFSRLSQGPERFLRFLDAISSAA